MHIPYLLLITISTLFLSGCQEEPPQKVKIPPQATQYNQAKQETESQQIEKQTEDAAAAVIQEPAAEEKAADKKEQPASEGQAAEEKTPPTVPVLEDFQGQPQLSLFPRVGDYQPPPDSERHPYWRTFIDHLVKVTGVAENQEDGSRGWVFRSINSIDSLGYFAPLAVKPNTTYTVSFELRAELPEDASAGIGILEFNQFLWIGEQYTEDTFKEHYRGVHEGKRLTGKPAGKQSFSFTTGPDTGMIHLILFREGEHDRNALMFDDIEVK